MDTLDLDHPNDTLGEQPAIQALPRMLPRRQPTAQSMMLAQQERIAENMREAGRDAESWFAHLDSKLTEVIVTQRLFMRDVLIALGVIFALVVLALLARV